MHKAIGASVVALLLGSAAAADDLEPGSVARGAELWAKCQTCHSVEPNGRTLVGPPLYGVLGRTAGTVPGYRYSEAMRNSGVIWSDQTLDRYLAATQEFMPGSKMYGGLAIAQDRADLLAWLHQRMKR